MKRYHVWFVLFMFASKVLAQLSVLPIGNYLRMEVWPAGVGQMTDILQFTEEATNLVTYCSQRDIFLGSYPAFQEDATIQYGKLRTLAQNQVAGAVSGGEFQVIASFGGKEYRYNTKVQDFRSAGPADFVIGLTNFEQVVISNVERFVLTATDGLEQDLATNGVAILGKDYLTGANRARFLVIDMSGQTNTYVQSGEPLQAPTMSLVLGPDGQVSLSVTGMTVGADTEIQASTNLTDWVTINYSDWTSGSSGVTLSEDDWKNWFDNQWGEDWTWVPSDPVWIPYDDGSDGGYWSDCGDWVPARRPPYVSPSGLFFRASSW